PSTDFSVAENRIVMKKALEKMRGEFNKRYPLRIDDKDIWTEREIISLNPSRRSEVVGRVSSASRAEADEALRVATNAWNFWKKVRPDVRASYLFRAAQVMREIRFELAAVEVYEVGKTWRDADSDITEAIDCLEYYGREMIRLGSPRRLGDYPGEENEYRYEPRGVGVVISPWNFPLAIPTGMVSASIVTGNCVIFKPSGLSPVTGSKLSEIFMLAGLPAGVLQFLPGSGEEIGDFLVSDPRTDFIAFTGSSDVGLGIIQHASKISHGQKNVKKVIAEMGGKNAIIVDETADLDEAVIGVLESSLGYQGQKCSACSRVVVAAEIHDELCERLKGAMGSIQIGPSELPSTFMGPVIDERAFKKIQGYIELGKKEGRAILERKADGEGYFVGPVLLVHVSPDSTVAQEEIFGPVLVVMRSKNIDQALEVANNTRYALTGGLFSRSPANIRKVKSEFRVGNLYINRRITGALVGRQPFGGFGMSGVGSKAGGPDYLLQFLNPRSISENTVRKGFAPLDQT
ncbi:MAG TPA: L-glutamate gamma-semialdehyde dehydrogenase, partial [Thermodesulfovibrionales bacterium]|nr:L-glutamate gamma-semialdehyde dehydrogenase [Thermodesulfovibrionales bacterium]